MAFQKLKDKLFNRGGPAPQPVFGVRLNRASTELPVVVKKVLAYFEKKGVYRSQNSHPFFFFFLN